MKKLCIILSILVIVGCAGYIAYDKITDFMVKKTLNIISEDETLKADIESALHNLSLPSESEAPQETDDAAEKSPEPSAKPDAAVSPDSEKKEGAIYPTAPPKTPEPKKNDGSLSVDDLNSADKAYVMSIYSRFSASEISTVSGMLSGGLTVEEKRAIKKIVYAKVSGSEIDRLYEIARKYQ